MLDITAPNTAHMLKLTVKDMLNDRREERACARRWIEDLDFVYQLFDGFVACFATLIRCLCLFLDLDLAGICDTVR